MIVTFSLETAFDGSMVLDKEILNWPPEHRKIKITHQSVCVQIVLKILWKLYVTKCFFPVKTSNYIFQWKQFSAGIVFNVIRKFLTSIINT